MKKIRILSIDGGGIRGILPGTILSYIEEQLQKKTRDPQAKIGQYFDLVCGTSTGGILALIYICPDKQGNFRFSAKEALSLYLNKGKEIFEASFFKKISSLGGILDEQYNADSLEKSLAHYFSTVQLHKALRPCLITSYDMVDRKSHFFTSADAKEARGNYYLKDIARATSAAPTYFEPAQIQSMAGKVQTLIDGGLFANNPTLCAYAEARSLDFSSLLADAEKPRNPKARDMFVVSLGTGNTEEPYPYKDFKNAGALRWIKPVLDIMMSGNSETVDYQLNQIFDTLSPKDAKDYHRIQPEIVSADNAMDNANKQNLQSLHYDGLRSVDRHQKELDSIVDQLVLHH